MVLVTDRKIPNRLSRVRKPQAKTEVRPTIDNESYESSDHMMSIEELEATLGLIARRIRDLSRS